MMYIYATSILVLVHATTSISVASTPSPYTASPIDPNYASPSTAEPAVDYKSNHPQNQHFPYARQFFEPLFAPNNPYSESLTSPTNPHTPKPFLFHRIPFLSSAHPFANPAYVEQPSPYSLPGYPAQSPYGLPGYPNQPLYEPQYPLSYAPKYVKNPYAAPADCDYHQPPSFRNTKPILFYPPKPENFFDSPLVGKPSNALYRFQPPPYGAASFATNIYH